MGHNDRLLTAVTATWCTCPKLEELTDGYEDTVMPFSHYVTAVTALKLNCHVPVCMKPCNYKKIFSLHLRSEYRKLEIPRASEDPVNISRHGVMSHRTWAFMNTSISPFINYIQLTVILGIVACTDCPILVRKIWDLAYWIKILLNGWLCLIEKFWEGCLGELN